MFDRSNEIVGCDGAKEGRRIERGTGIQRTKGKERDREN
jgi:hypothetical protein